MSLTDQVQHIKTKSACVQNADANTLKCKCQSDFVVRLARQNEYDKFKSLLNKGKHPAFIGRQTFSTNANNGGALFYEFSEMIVGVSLINPRLGILLALNVHPEHRGHGLGKAIIDFLMPNFARVIESKVLWFKNCGYVPVGKLKRGISLNTQIMVRQKLLFLAGNLQKVWK